LASGSFLIRPISIIVRAVFRKTERPNSTGDDRYRHE
jgi:hypothetical protein